MEKKKQKSIIDLIHDWGNERIKDFTVRQDYRFKPNCIIHCGRRVALKVKHFGKKVLYLNNNFDVSGGYGYNIIRHSKNFNADIKLVSEIPNFLNTNFTNDLLKKDKELQEKYYKFIKEEFIKDLDNALKVIINYIDYGKSRRNKSFYYNVNFDIDKLLKQLEEYLNEEINLPNVIKKRFLKDTFKINLFYTYYKGWSSRSYYRKIANLECKFDEIVNKIKELVEEVREIVNFKLWRNKYGVDIDGRYTTSLNEAKKIYNNSILKEEYEKNQQKRNEKQLEKKQYNLFDKFFNITLPEWRKNKNSRPIHLPINKSTVTYQFFKFKTILPTLFDVACNTNDINSIMPALPEPELSIITSMGVTISLEEAKKAIRVLTHANKAACKRIGVYGVGDLSTVNIAVFENNNIVIKETLSLRVGCHNITKYAMDEFLNYYKLTVEEILKDDFKFNNNE